jgi:hypothetical protein
MEARFMNDGNQEQRMTKTGVGVTLYRGFVENGRPGFALLFHQATGLVREYDFIREEAERFAKMEPYAPEVFGPESAAKTLGTIQGQLYAHRAMLQIQCANAASSLLIAYDNMARNAADFCGKKVADIIGGPEVNGITLLEAIRAAADWTRHHYEWSKGHNNQWPVRTLQTIGLDINDNVLPARIFGLYGFNLHGPFESICVTAFRLLVHSWKLEDEEGPP